MLGGRNYTTQRPSPTACWWLGALPVCLLAGCLAGPKHLTYLDEAEFKYSRDVQLKIAHPTDEDPGASRPEFARQPRRLRNTEKGQLWDLPIEEALKLALANCDVIRENGQFLSPSNRLLANPDFVQSIYNPAILDTSVAFGRRGTSAALADFDTTLSSSMSVGHSEQIQRMASTGLGPGDTLVDDTGQFRSSLSKTLGDGSQLSVSHNLNYSRNNLPTGGFQPSSLFESSWFSTPQSPALSFEYRRPLWQGAGRRYTGIAAPRLSRFGGATAIVGVNQGVIIARINNDISLADFEAAVRNLVRDVEVVYWNLHLAYRVFHSQKVALDSAEQTWRLVDSDNRRGDADRAQARDNYFEIKERTQTARSNIYSTETRFRRLLGLPVNDGRIIRPSDEPISAELLPDWESCLQEALLQRVELRRQKWNIRSYQLQLEAARSLSQPQLDLVTSHQVNALGNTLTNSRREQFASFYGTLTSGNHMSSELRFEFSIPLGNRIARAQIRNLELLLAKARAILNAQEIDISHELASAFQELDRAYLAAQANRNRQLAADKRVRLVQIEFDAGRTSLDLFLRAQVSLSEAEIAYFQSLVAYTKAIADLEYRKGTLLEHNNVRLAEGPWSSEAYKQALRRAEARSHGIDTQLLRTIPAPVEREEE